MDGAIWGGTSWGVLLLPLMLNAKFLYYTEMFLGVFYDNLLKFGRSAAAINANFGHIKYLCRSRLMGQWGQGSGQFGFDTSGAS